MRTLGIENCLEEMTLALTDACPQGKFQSGRQKTVTESNVTILKDHLTAKNFVVSVCHIPNMTKNQKIPLLTW